MAEAKAKYEAQKAAEQAKSIVPLKLQFRQELVQKLKDAERKVSDDTAGSSEQLA